MFRQVLVDGKAIAQGQDGLFDDQALFLKLERKMENKFRSGQISFDEIEKIRSIVLIQAQNRSPRLDTVLRNWFRIEASRLEMTRNREKFEALTEALSEKNGESDLVKKITQFGVSSLLTHST